MSPLDLVLILALTAYAVYQQTKRHRLDPATRFRLAIIYGGIGVVVGGLSVPHSASGIAILGVSIAISLGVGWLRGSFTRVWTDGTSWFSQGTVLTVSLFLAMIASKFALGTVAYLLHVPDSTGIGEVLVMIGAMMAFQAQIIHRRALRLRSRAASAAPTPSTAVPSTTR